MQEKELKCSDRLLKIKISSLEKKVAAKTAGELLQAEMESDLAAYKAEADKRGLNKQEEQK